MQRIFSLSLLLLLGACASPIASVQSKYVVGQNQSSAQGFTVNICRPSGSEHFYKSVGLEIDYDAAAEIGSGESYQFSLPVVDKYWIGFYPPEMNVIAKLMGREKRFGIVLDGKSTQAYVILSTDNLMLSLEQEKEGVIKNYYEGAIYPWQVRTVKKPLFDKLCSDIKKTYLFKKISTN